MPGITNRVFGDDIPLKIKAKLAMRQAFAKSLDVNQALESTEKIYGIEFKDIPDYSMNFGDIGAGTNFADLSSRTPFARMWAAVGIEEWSPVIQGTNGVQKTYATKKEASQDILQLKGKDVRIQKNEGGYGIYESTPFQDSIIHKLC
jgi:hypothetical protein